MTCDRVEVTCANAGHNSMALFGPGKPPRFVFPSTGMVAGLFPGNSVSDESMDLVPGDTLVLFSDGVTEAFSKEEELFGDERLLAQLGERSRAERRRDRVQHPPGGPQSCSRSPSVRRHLDCRGALRTILNA